MDQTTSSLNQPLPKRVLVGGVLAGVAFIAVRHLWMQQAWPAPYAAMVGASALVGLCANNLPQLRAHPRQTLAFIGLLVGVVVAMIALVESRL